MRSRGQAFAGGLLLLLAACAGGQRPAERRLERADPSQVIAAELALSRVAQEKGQWSALAEFATGDAVMFVPLPVVARQWLRQQQNPAQAIRRRPHQVWSSCDGSLAVTRGARQQADGSAGSFTTVWQRQGNGDYRWVMDQGDLLAEPLAAREMIEAKVADYNAAPGPNPPDIVATGQVFGGRSRDGTLSWDVLAQADGTRVVNARYWTGTQWEYAVRERAAAP